ncbi:MAG: EI24 domain-containing protein [Rhodospirillaceae bacterium]|nr:EI24 domain-containing protein [Rhodospirillaceae bacterium]
MFSAFAKTLGQMNDPRIRGVIGKTLALAILGYILFVVLIYLLIGWLAGLSGWLEGLAQFGGALGAMVVAWFIFPGIAAAIAGIFADEVIDAVEAKHYPNLGPARRLSVWSVVVDGLQLAGIALIANLVALPFLVVFPVYVLITWGVNGWLLGREYFEMVAFRRLDRDAARALHRQHKGTFTLAGILIAICLTIPFVNLIAPVLGAAFMVHIAQNVVNQRQTGAHVSSLGR